MANLANNRCVRTLLSAAAISAGFFSASPSWAELPPAGSVIGNQASATYVDSAGVSRSTSSNLVQTIIAQVAGVDIEATQTKPITPGATVYFPHTIVNTGNGSDTYSLTLGAISNSFDFSSVVIYADANKDGIPDNFTPITSTPTLAAGASFNVVVAAVVPATATSGQIDSVSISATSGFSATITDSNTDTATVTNNAVVSFTKSENIQTGAPGTMPIVVTLTYTNTGNATATSVVVSDSLPVGMTYLAGTGRWSVSGNTALTDPAAGDPAGIDYEVTGSLVKATLASLPPGQSGYVSFSVGIANGTAPGSLPNTARYTYNDGSGAIISDVPTNTVNFTVTATQAVSLSDVNSTTDTDGSNANDTVTVAAVTQGGTVVFDNVLVNNGTGPDSFDISLSGSTFPAGTSFIVYRPDGVTVMTDSNGNGVADTGPVAAGATVHVIVKALLPAGATGGAYSVSKKATSTSNPAVSDTTTDTLTAITANTVDLTNSSPGPAAPGAGVTAMGEAAAVTTATVNPGATTTLSLFINNTSTVPDSYNLQASTDRTFTTVVLPAGWSVVFRRTADNAVITNTGTLAPGASLGVTATITVPANASPATVDLYFRTVSPASGAADVKHDAVQVNTVHDLALMPNNIGQIFPGGSITYPHTLTNLGNVAETSSALSSGNSLPGWTSVVYFDSNGNGMVDPSDTVITNLSQAVSAAGLAPGASINLLVQVYAPSGAAQGLSNATSLTAATVTGETNTANNASTDTTTVVTGDVQLSKTQALDADCDGVSDSGSFSQATISSAAAKPGACILYRITALNSGASPASSLVVNDATPPLTTYDGAHPAAATVSGVVIITPANGGTGALSFNVGVLAPASSATLSFAVKINE